MHWQKNSIVCSKCGETQFLNFFLLDAVLYKEKVKIVVKILIYKKRKQKFAKLNI